MTWLAPGLLALTLGSGDPLPSVSCWPEEMVTGGAITLPSAFRVGLDRCDFVRTIRLGVSGLGAAWIHPPYPAHFESIHGLFGGDRIIDGAIPPVAIGPHNADILISRGSEDTPAWPFKADVIAFLATVERTYWHLWQAQSELAARVAACQRAAALPTRDQGSTPDPAPARQRAALGLARYQAEHDRATAERQLRSLLGMADSPATPIEAVSTPPTLGHAPDRDQSQRQMAFSNPAIHFAREAAVAATFDDRIWFPSRAENESRADQIEFHERRDHAQAHLRLVVAEADARLDAACRAVGVTGERVAAADRAVVVAADRLDRTPTLGAITEHADAVAQAARDRVRHAEAILDWQVAMGTLLTHAGVNVAGDPRPTRPAPQVRAPLRVPLALPTTPP